MRTVRLLGVMLIALSTGAAGLACRYECSRDTDCQGGEGKSCAPREAWCEAGTCKSQCARTCRTDISDVNSCAAGAVCTDTAAMTATFGQCTVLAIPCATAADCPAYRPRNDAGAQLDWSCVDGVCSYPGLAYARGTP